MNISNVLVTGAAGLIGSAVSNLLIRDGLSVVGCDDFSIGTWRPDDKRIKWKDVDVSSPLFPEEMDGCGIDAVVHCAAHPGGRSLAEPSEDVRVNCLGSMRVFEWCARRGLPVIYLSSSIIYGEQPSMPIPETATLKPGTVYGICKIACENYLKILEQGFGLKWTVLRFFSTYGAGHTPSETQGIVNVMITQLLKGNRITVKGSLKRMRDMIYVEDAANAIAACLRNENTRGLVMNAGTGVAVGVGEMIYTLNELLGRRREEIEIVEDAPTVGDPLYNVADISLLKSKTGFQPAFDLRKGLGILVRKRSGRHI